MSSLKNAALLSVAVLVLAGCSPNAGTASSSAANDTIDIVATTDVYANVAEAVAGDVKGVEIKPIIASTSQDPHSYEATTKDRLTVKDAEIVVLNGGGYDLFMEDMAGVDNKDQSVVNAVKLSGLISEDDYSHLLEGHSHAHGAEGHDHADHADHDHGDRNHADSSEAAHDHAAEGHDHHDHGSFNEHVWYNFDTMTKVAQDVAEKLAERDSKNADTYRANAKDFAGKMQQLTEETKALNLSGKKFISSEPVPNYLLTTAGMEDHTPAEYVEAVEAESDVAPLTLQEIKDDIAKGDIQLLGYNKQTETAQTTEIRSAAEAAHVPAVSFTETLPEGKTYLEWMQDNLKNLKDAVA